MKYFIQCLTVASSIMALSITTPAGANEAPSSKNSKAFDFGLNVSQNSNFIDKIFPNSSSPYRLIPVIVCIKNNQTGLLCLDGFCDTSPANLCNGHQGVSPGHNDDKSSIYSI